MTHLDKDHLSVSIPMATAPARPFLLTCLIFAHRGEVIKVFKIPPTVFLLSGFAGRTAATVAMVTYTAEKRATVVRLQPSDPLMCV